MRNIFLNTMQKIRLKIPYRYREIVKIEIISLSYDSMSMFTQSQNPSNFVWI